MSDAFDTGGMGFDLGDDLSMNPYDEADAQHDEWEDGWIARRNDVECFQAEYDFTEEGDK